MDELLAQFLVEGPELVQAASDALLDLERKPGDRRLIDDAFRAVHTLKGSVGLFDLPAMAAVLHAAEDVLGAVRDEGRPLEPAVTDHLMAALAQTERWLEALARNAGPPPDAGSAAARLVAAFGLDKAAPAASADGDGEAASLWAEALAAKARASVGPRVAIRYRPDANAFFRGDDPVGLMASVPGLAHLALSLAPPPPGEVYDPFHCRLVIEALSTDSLEAVRAAVRLAADQVELVEIAGGTAPEDEAGRSTAREAAARALRVDAGQIETLGVLAEELIAARTSLADIVSRAASVTWGGGEAREIVEGLAARSGHIDRLAGRLLQGVTALRMTPVGPLLRRFHRVSRETAAGLGKSVTLIVEDGDVAADTAVIEGLVEPLTHLLRNAIDHGVETPDQRRAAGKPEQATLRLSARQRDGQIVVRLEDDGRGIDPEAVREAAIRRDPEGRERLMALSETECIDLIFTPGLSTAGAVSALSGRGVGMDAVRAAARRLGGQVRMDSKPGRGVTAELRLPLSLTLNRIMVVTCAGERFGVPIDRILETVRTPRARISAIRSGRAFEWRGRATPLISLSSLVGGDAMVEADILRIVVVQAQDLALGLAVDSIDERLDVVMRPLEGLLASVPGLAGTTVLGDGAVMMILDPEALVG